MVGSAPCWYPGGCVAPTTRRWARPSRVFWSSSRRRGSGTSRSRRSWCCRPCAGSSVGDRQLVMTVGAVPFDGGRLALDVDRVDVAGHWQVDTAAVRHPEHHLLDTVRRNSAHAVLAFLVPVREARRRTEHLTAQRGVGRVASA